MMFPKVTNLIDGNCEWRLSANDILALYNNESIESRHNVDCTDVIQWMEMESIRHGWKSIRWFFEGNSRGCFLRKFNDPLPTVKGCQEIALEKSVTELLTTAITKIAQHACRQGEISSRVWPSLSELPAPESWKSVGQKYSREIAIEIMQMYFAKGNFLTDLAKLAGRDAE